MIKLLLLLVVVAVTNVRSFILNVNLDRFVVDWFGNVFTAWDVALLGIERLLLCLFARELARLGSTRTSKEHEGKSFANCAGDGKPDPDKRLSADSEYDGLSTHAGPSVAGEAANWSLIRLTPRT